MKEPHAELWPTRVVVGGRAEELPDPVVVEEPLEIQVGGRPLVVTMRTPGHDAELAAGWLYGEGLVETRDDLLSIADASACGAENVVSVRLRDESVVEPARAARGFLSTSACGVCGKTAIEHVFARGLPGLAPGRPRIDAAWLEALPARMRAAQPVFARTGGLHAAALFAAGGELLVLREDVGRHNAVDKVCGWLLERGKRPAREGLLWVSGRAGAELVLKAARSGVPALASVGAPSSLAVHLAEAAGMTLIGFLREGRMNVYAGEERLRD